MALISTPDNPAPAGAIEQHINAVDGVRLRTARWIPPSPVGTVAVLGGRGEFIEKYFEVIAELAARGFAVAAMDWRGQGGSQRSLPDARKGHVDDFVHFERDLDALVEQILERECPRPWFALCHSMGASVLLRLAGRERFPFERLVLTSPMIAVKGVKHRGRAASLLALFDSLGMGSAYAPGGGGKTQWLSRFEGNVFTSDEKRFARIAEVVAASPELTLDGPTIRWARAAFRHMRSLEDPKPRSRPSPPILIVAAGSDRVTDTEAAERFASRLATARFVVIDGAQHEILIERDEVRARFWAEFDQFIPSYGRSSRRA
jgi:lysophospholipase